MYYVYILQCADDTLYTGQTNNIERRLEEHRSGKGSKYVKSRLPVELVYTETFKTRGAAMRREIEIKKYPRPKKLDLVNNSSSENKLSQIENHS